MWLALMMLPQIFVGIFNNDPALMEITTWSIKIYFAGIFIFGVQVACQQTFLALGQAKISLILALLRKIILLVPLIFILPMVIENQLFGVLLAEPIADILAATTTIICFMVFYKKTLSVVDANESKDIKNDIIDNN
jgi:Na+-driven multidrug efflux pump